MGVFITTLKTHGRTDLTNRFEHLNNCIVHGCKPSILDIVAGKDKMHHYVAVCKSEECNKIVTSSADDVVKAWNKYNPE